MQERQDLEADLKTTLALLKERIDDTMDYLDKHPKDTDYASKLWSSTVRDFLNYGVKKSKLRSRENLFKKISRMLIFGK